MKKLILLFLFIGFGAVNYAQIHDPVKWITSVEKISDTEYDLIINASIESNWHLYSQSVPEDGPIPTSFVFEASENFELI